MRKSLLFIILVCILITLIGCGRKFPAVNNNGFSEDKAISMVIKDHSEFPSNKIDTITKKLPTGGPSGTTADVKFKTNVEKSSGDSYNVTLIKDWGISVSDT